MPAAPTIATIPVLPHWISDPQPTSMQWELVTHTQSQSSPLTGSTQILVYPNAHWRAHVSYAIYGEEQVRAIMSFVLSLGGPQTRFIFFPPHGKTPKGQGSGIVKVDGTKQKGKSLATKGWVAPDGSSTVLKKGDYITLLLKNGQNSLHSLTDDATATGGKANLAITPALRSEPADESRVITHDCFCIMRLANDQQSRFSFEKMSQATMHFELIESYS